MLTDEIHIGIDPGWKNLGIAVLKRETDGEFRRVETKVLVPADYTSIPAFIDALDEFVLPLVTKIESVTIERFVTYAGVSTTESENICMLIGAMSYYFAAKDIWNVEPKLVRAIDWKSELVKTLVKTKGFDNPSDKLDKKFSIAAAHACIRPEDSGKIPTDHEADAICLAAFQPLTKKVKQ